MAEKPKIAFESDEDKGLICPWCRSALWHCGHHPLKLLKKIEALQEENIRLVKQLGNYKDLKNIMKRIVND